MTTAGHRGNKFVSKSATARGSLYVDGRNFSDAEGGISMRKSALGLIVAGLAASLVVSACSSSKSSNSSGSAGSGGGSSAAGGGGTVAAALQRAGRAMSE